ncbi:GNAT domain-containing protein [Flammula alnicola]|nr:GNAT domain-containing protein [Flammula alnicola]
MMAQNEIWTERLLLRGAEEKDLRAFAKWFSDPVAMKFWSTAPHSTIEQTKGYLDAMIASPNNGVMDFSVCLSTPTGNPTEPETDGASSDSDGASSDSDGASSDSDGASSDSDDAALVVIGKAGLWDGKEIGFIFDREYWGKGYAFEALDAILRHVWALEGDAPEVITADVDPRNGASLRLLAKLGFVKVGSAEKTYETHIGWCDSVYLEAKKPTE